MKTLFFGFTTGREKSAVGWSFTFAAAGNGSFNVALLMQLTPIFAANDKPWQSFLFLRSFSGRIHALPPDVTALERGCVVLNQPQHVETPEPVRFIPTAMLGEAAAVGLRPSRAPGQCPLSLAIEKPSGKLDGVRVSLAETTALYSPLYLKIATP